MTFAEQFLSKIWGHSGAGWGEIRTIKDGKIKQYWIPVPLDATIEVPFSVIENLDLAGWDVYFGVLPRQSRHGTSGNIALDQVLLWADFDGKDHKFAAFDRMMRVRPVPQVVIDSGYGYHAYWFLREPIHREIARQIMRGMSILHKSDHTYDAARILRVPETSNHKNGTAVRVRPIKFDLLGPHYTPSDFSEYQMVGRMAEQPAHIWIGDHGVATGGNVPQNLPDWLQDLIQFGGSSGDRSKDGFKVCCAGIKRGYSKDDIERWFMDNSNGIGQKYHEKNMGSRWFNLTYSSAVQAASYG